MDKKAEDFDGNAKRQFWASTTFCITTFGAGYFRHQSLKKHLKLEAF